MYNIFKKAQKKHLLDMKNEKIKQFYNVANRLIKNKLHEIAFDGIQEFLEIFVTERDGFFKNFGLI